MPKPRNPGFNAGDHWAICDVCGWAYRQEDMRKRWDNAIVCKHDWEIRHPQDFLRAKYEDQSAKGLVRPEPKDNFLPKPPTVRTESLGITEFQALGLTVGNFDSLSLDEDTLITGTVSLSGDVFILSEDIFFTEVSQVQDLFIVEERVFFNQVVETDTITLEEDLSFIIDSESSAINAREINEIVI